MSGAGAGGFEAATGDGPAPTGPAADRRAAEVRVAFEGLRQIRRLMNQGPADPAAVPAPWEREQPVRAVALALEAQGIPPSAVAADGRRTATGYVVRTDRESGRVRVGWLGPPGGGAAEEEADRLAGCAAALEPLGWDCPVYRGPRNRRFLEVTPAR
ncbi:hypothetical protein [Streptomyces sp. NPDC089919]|uniref:hypothetical protein n=1 Tax=Streptomyces sp. NPDC089919 TaxID=3155188 RepID=UPI003438A689